MLSSGFLALLGLHALVLHRLSRWVEDPAGEPLEAVPGAWRAVFDRLDRRVRDERDERRRLAEALERFRAASQAMPDGVIYLGADDSIEWLNARAEAHFGLDHARDLGVPLVGLARQPDLARCLESPPSGAPLVMQSPRRPAIRLLVQVVPFGDGQKMLVSRDITQLEKLETMRRDFVANVSHELRTPLTVVGGFIETVMDGLDDLDRDVARRYLALALEQSTRMQRLIEDLLALSALETGAPAPAEEPVDALQLVGTIHKETVALSGGQHAIRLSIDARDEGDVLVGCQKELHSAFANLASNAVRYTPHGGTITIGWRRLVDGAEYFVEDDGIGIDPQHIPRLTERFFRVDRGRSRQTGGTGLGLAIVKHVASRHQAELRIDSAPGRGSRFSVWLPAARLRRPKAPLRT